MKSHDNDNGTLPRSAIEAKLIGSQIYFTGEKCKSGHAAPRYTSSRSCVQCTSESAQRRKLGDPEKWRAQRKAQRERSFERNPERLRSHTRKWMKKWRCENPEKSKAKMKKWRQDHPERTREFQSKCRARRLCAEGTHSAADIQRLLDLQGYKCAECLKSVRKKYHVDHITPLARGGTNWPDNLQILCPSCNQHKHASDPIDFARSKGRLL